jgi:hypothetical protein
MDLYGGYTYEYEPSFFEEAWDYGMEFGDLYIDWLNSTPMGGSGGSGSGGGDGTGGSSGGGTGGSAGGGSGGGG